MRTASKLSLADLILLQTLVESKGSTSFSKIKSQLSNFGGCGEVSISTISRHVRNKLPNARKYLNKRLGKFALRSAKLQMFDDQSCHVWYPIRSCFGVTCSRLDASDGVFYLSCCKANYSGLHLRHIRLISCHIKIQKHLKSTFD